MESTTLTPPDGEKRFVDNDLARTLLLAAMAAGLGLALYFGWANSPLSGHLQPAVHVETKTKDEVDRRFREGVAMLRGKQYAQALSAFQRVLELRPNMPEAHVNAGYALLGLGEYRAAADLFDTATTLRPDQLNAYYGLGEALQEMGDKQAALQAMEAYLHRSPASDPFRRKAESAVWELRAELEKDRPLPPPGEAPHRRAKSGEAK
jgi:tetratricopeptide (TPR) repeat protein